MISSRESHDVKHALLFPVLPAIKNFDHLVIPNDKIGLSLWCRVITWKCIICSRAVFSIFVYQLFTILPICLLFMWPMLCKNIFRHFIFVVTKKFRSRLRIKFFLKRPYMAWVDLKWPVLTPPKVVPMAHLGISGYSTRVLELPR